MTDAPPSHGVFVQALSTQSRDVCTRGVPCPINRPPFKWRSQFAKPKLQRAFVAARQLTYRQRLGDATVCWRRLLHARGTLPKVEGAKLHQFPNRVVDKYNGNHRHEDARRNNSAKDEWPTASRPEHLEQLVGNVPVDNQP